MQGRDESVEDGCIRGRKRSNVVESGGSGPRINKIYGEGNKAQLLECMSKSKNKKRGRMYMYELAWNRGVDGEAEKLALPR